MKHLPDLFQRRSLFSANPYRDLMDLQKRMDRFFGEGWAATSPDVDAWVPSCDVEESDSDYRLSFDLPGVKKEDIKIDLQDGILTVSGERQTEVEKRDKKNQNTMYSERFYGSFMRSFRLPNQIHADQIEASYHDGVLTLKVPKLAEIKTQPSRIKVA